MASCEKKKAQPSHQWYTHQPGIPKEEEGGERKKEKGHSAGTLSVFANLATCIGAPRPTRHKKKKRGPQ